MGDDEYEYYDEYYDYSDEVEPSNARPPPVPKGRGPAPVPPGMRPRGAAPPPVTPRARPPPVTPRGVPPALPTNRGRPGPPAPKKIEQDEYYDSYYEYEYEEEPADVYEYDYDEIYEYDYEYDDEPGMNGPPIARPKGPYTPGQGPFPPGGNNFMNSLNPNLLSSAKSGLNQQGNPDDRPKPARSTNRPLGLTSTKIAAIRGGMNHVEMNKNKGPVRQVDFRGNLKIASSIRASKDGGPKTVQPVWVNPNLRKGARPMTTNLQVVDTERIRAQVQAAKARAVNRNNNQPRFMNGMPVGRTSVKKFRPKHDGIDTSVLSSGMVKKVETVQRAQAGDNPNRFLTKNRVSVKIRKKVEKPNGLANGQSVRIKRRVPSSRMQRPTGDATGSSRFRSRRIKRGESSRLKPVGGGESRRVKRGESSRMRKGGESRRVKRGESSRMRKRGESSRIRDPNKATDPNRVSRRRRRNPNVSRTSVNHNIFGAKTKPAPDVQGVGLGDGCYLRYDPNNGGVLYAQWTVIGFEKSDALAYFKPKTPVPRFKYRRNDGREDLLSRTSGDFKQYAEAWTYFFVMAKEFDGVITLFQEAASKPFVVEIVGLTKNFEVVNLNYSSKLLCDLWMCLACMPQGHTSFQGMPKANPDFFMDNASREGFGVRMMD